ncbi:hypothetical protein KVR01_005542 [Diaporthe batatas]|uniref:uncharacterized protein n=1 Tax=Diaporthe batatas TaxID=748121 RepID=UPI001D0543F0|nr:uncharacterized protein KVR01_005542 [Diaporthe batatas]KAG8165267.1 hypothetical protein KVR01_005542 [Diaporthe batatas]
MSSSLSLVFGPSSPPLWNKTVADLIHEQESKYADREAVVVPWQSARLTYGRLGQRSALLAKALLGGGFKRGDCVGIMAGNCYQYLEIFLGAGRIGCPVAVFNNTFSPRELKAMIERTDCKGIFIAPEVGNRNLQGHLRMITDAPRGELPIRLLVLLAEVLHPMTGIKCQTYDEYMASIEAGFVSDSLLSRAESKVAPADVVNFSFTSGTTGLSKAAALTNNNIINNGRYLGLAMQLTEEDVLCCPPPLFHAFGLVIGFLTSFCHGSKIVFPAPTFDANAALDAVVQEKATALLGVPSMFLAILEELKKTPRRIEAVRTGIAGGAAVPPVLIRRLEREMGLPHLLTAYGMTETGPVSFVTSIEDTRNGVLGTVGQVLPHCAGKVVDGEDNIVPRGTPGHICTSGHGLQKGYWGDKAQTAQAMRPDAEGVVWMYTGDEGFLDQAGYMHITGRIKDIIIRGGENISPIEIEGRLAEHPDIKECCVVGLEDSLYGEVVSCFLGSAGARRPSDNEIRSWVKAEMDHTKAPSHIFWLGEPDVGEELPKTGSGKYQKHLIQAKGNALLKSRGICAKL